MRDLGAAVEELVLAVEVSEGQWLTLWSQPEWKIVRSARPLGVYRYEVVFKLPSLAW